MEPESLKGLFFFKSLDFKETSRYVELCSFCFLGWNMAIGIIVLQSSTAARSSLRVDQLEYSHAASAKPGMATAIYHC